MTRSTKYILYTSWWIFLLLFTTCFHKDFDKSDIERWQPRFAFPLVNASISVADLLSNLGEQGSINANNDLIELYYTKRLLSASGSDLIKIPDIQISGSGDTLRIEFDFPDGLEANSLLLNQAILDFLLSTTSKNETEVKISIPGAEKDGESFISEIIIPADMGNQYSNSLDLGGYNLSLFRNAQGKHYFDLIIDARDSGTGVKIEIDFEGIIRAILYSYIEGQFKDFNLGQYLDTLNLEIFQNWISGQIIVTKPQINIRTDNSFGFPVSVLLKNFGGTRGSVIRNLEGVIINSNWIPDYPSGRPGQSEADEFIIDDKNSNLSNFLAISPSKIFYAIELDGEIDIDLDIPGFMTDSSRLVVDMDILIPLECRIEEVMLRKTLPLNIAPIEHFTEINFIVDSENAFPHDIALQIYLANNELVVLDSLFESPALIIRSGNTNGIGEVISSVKTKTNVKLSEARLQTIYDSKQIIYEIRLNAGIAPGVVRYTQSNKMNLNIRAEASLKSGK
jgi:hypothetical protein